MFIPQYNLGTKFCRTFYKSDGVCIFIRENILFSKINLDKLSKDNDLEICAVKLHFSTTNIVIISIYRSPSGDLHYFLHNLELILNSLYSNTTNIIIYGDFNINCLQDNTKKQQSDSLLALYNLYSTVTFPTRILGNSSSLLDSIFINTSKYKDYTICPVINGLSDHDAQIITLDNILFQNDYKCAYNGRRINSSSIMDLKLNLSYESWDNIVTNEDVDTIFNNLLNTYLRIFNANFPIKKFPIQHSINPG
jgi:exonuclease III